MTALKKAKKKIRQTSKANKIKTKWMLFYVLVLFCSLVLTLFVLPHRQSILQEAANIVSTPTPTYSAGASLLNNGFVDYPPNMSPANTHTMAVNGTQQTVTYCNGEQMDIFTPSTPGTCMPAAIYVHGGGWISGSRTQLAPPVETPGTINGLLGQGFIVASIDYHMGSTPAAGYPQNIQDVACAVRYIRSNASQMHIDPGHIGLWGDSAGGHLVALAGLADQTGGFDTGPFPGISSKVQAVEDLFGPTTLAAAALGSQQANPITWINKTANTDPPFLILQGTADTIVPSSDSQALNNALTSAGQPVTLQMVQNAGHEFVPSGGTISPSDSQLTTMMINFFLSHLKVANGGTCSPTVQPTQPAQPSQPIPTPTFACLGNTCPTLAPTGATSSPQPTSQLFPSTPSTPSVAGLPNIGPTQGQPQNPRSLLQQFLLFLLNFFIFLRQFFP